MSSFTTAIHRYTLRGHVLQFSTFADEAARLAATGFIADSVGRVYRQISDGTFWLLLDDSPIAWVQIDIGTEVAAARAPFATLAAHVNNNTQLSAMNFFPSPIVGEYFDPSINSTSVTNRTSAANRMELMPITMAKRTRIDEIGLYVTTGVALAEAKLLIYGSDANGWPDNLILETVDIPNATSATYESVACDEIFEAGVIYWVGSRTNSTQTLAVVAVAASRNLGRLNNTATTSCGALRRALTYATPAPDPWVFVAADRFSNIGGTSVRMRVAAL